MGPLDIKEKEDRDLSWEDAGNVLNKVNEAFEWVDDQVGIPGTDIDVQHARDLITDPLDKIHPVAGLVGEVLVPDSTDLLGGAGYVKRGVKNIPEITRVLRQTDIMNNILGGTSARLRGIRALFDGNPFLKHIGTGSDGTRYRNRFGITEDNIIDFRKTIFGTAVGKGDVFDFDEYLKLAGTNKGRAIASAYTTIPAKRASYKALRTRLMPEFLAEYGPALKAMGIKESRINLHHIFSLKASMPLYDGVKYGSDTWDDITEALLKKNVFGGDAEQNLALLAPQVHNQVHSFLTHKVGSQGKKFFTDSVRDKMKRDPVFRIEMANKYADIVNQSKTIIEEGNVAWKALYSNKAFMPEDLVNTLIKTFPSGKMKEYDITTVRNIIREVTIDHLLKPRNFKPNTLHKIVEARELAEEGTQNFSKLTHSQKIQKLEEYTGHTLEDLQQKLQTTNFNIEKFLKFYD